MVTEFSLLIFPVSVYLFLCFLLRQFETFLHHACGQLLRCSCISIFSLERFLKDSMSSELCSLLINIIREISSPSNILSLNSIEAVRFSLFCFSLLSFSFAFKIPVVRFSCVSSMMPPFHVSANRHRIKYTFERKVNS